MEELLNTVQEKIDRLPADRRVKWQLSLDVMRRIHSHDTNPEASERLAEVALMTVGHLDVLLADPHVKEPSWDD